MKVYVVDMDLEKFFDTVCQNKLIEVLSWTVKDGLFNLIRIVIFYIIVVVYNKLWEKKNKKLYLFVL